MALFDLFKKKTPLPPPDGLATVHAPDGSIFRGKFRNGLREGSGYTYVVKGKTCTSYRCAYRNGVRHGCCTVMTCDDFRFGEKNEWEGSHVEFYENGERIETDSWDYSWVDDYRHYLLERELYDKCGREKYEARQRTEQTTLDEKGRQTPGSYAREHAGPYYALADAFDAGRYFEIVDALVYGFSYTRHGELPYNTDEQADAFTGLHEALAKKGLLENKRGFASFDDYMVYALNCFYECIIAHPCDFYVNYTEALPFLVACLYNQSEEDWRYLWGIRRFYLRYVNGAMSYYMYLLDLKEHLEDFDNTFYTAVETAMTTRAFRDGELYDRAVAHYEADNYDRYGGWLREE